MKLIIGLGNPGERYDGTRHNVGFDVIDALLSRHQLKMTDQKFRADYTVAHINGNKCVLVKPYTYMNLSGEALMPLMAYYGVGLDDIVVVYDDLDLSPGRIRLRQSGSAGGHNGVKSIIHMMDSNEFKRIKVGIGRPTGGWKVADYVLAKFNVDERIDIDNAIDETVDALEAWLEGKTFLEVMNEYNRKK